MDTAERTKLFEKLKKQIDDNSRRTVRLEEKHELAVTNMKKIVADIKAAGYDPKTLATVKADLEARLDSELENVRQAVEAQTAAISEIEASL